jgi:undecaprenyl-diphosphatase
MRIVISAVRFIDRQFRRHRIDSGILLAFLVMAATLLGFIELASDVMEGDTLAFDRWLLQALRDPADPSRPAGPAWLREFMLDVTALGGVSVLAVITAIAAGYLLAVRKVRTATFVTIAVSSGALVGTLLKQGFLRARPDLVAHLVDVDTASFPSGHAMNSAITYLTLTALLARSEKSRPVRIYLLTVGIGVTILVGFSRVYLGVHWPTDVVAGWCVGGAWAVLCSLAARALERRKTIDAPHGNAESPG